MVLDQMMSGYNFINLYGLRNLRGKTTALTRYQKYHGFILLVFHCSNFKISANQLLSKQLIRQ